VFPKPFLGSEQRSSVEREELSDQKRLQAHYRTSGPWVWSKRETDAKIPKVSHL